ncbi:hypothetical protein [Streptococcus pneumoniae]|uniref:hypothetical protein n=1 Tax=Streptococcus pneumoniae TaxID=1313 RepID=UPI0015DA2791|nr:hypothetical protein [Streptococcus pneumoniae]
MSSKKHPLGEKRNHTGSKLRQGFWMVFRLGVNNWGFKEIENKKPSKNSIAGENEIF